MILKMIVFLPSKTLSEQRRLFSAMIIMFSDRYLVPLPGFQRLGGVMERCFEKNCFRSKFGAAYVESLTKVWLAT